MWFLERGKKMRERECNERKKRVYKRENERRVRGRNVSEPERERERDK